MKTSTLNQTLSHQTPSRGREPQKRSSTIIPTLLTITAMSLAVGADLGWQIKQDLKNQAQPHHNNHIIPAIPYRLPKTPFFQLNAFSHAAAKGFIPGESSQKSIDAILERAGKVSSIAAPKTASLTIAQIARMANNPPQAATASEPTIQISPALLAAITGGEKLQTVFNPNIPINLQRFSPVKPMTLAQLIASTPSPSWINHAIKNMVGNGVRQPAGVQGTSAAAEGQSQAAVGTVTGNRPALTFR